MVKKKYFLLLSTLLLTVLLGLSGTCYAAKYILSDADYNNLFATYPIDYPGQNTATLKSNFKSVCNSWNNTYDLVCIVISRSSSFYLYQLYTIVHSQVDHVVDAGDVTKLNTFEVYLNVTGGKRYNLYQNNSSLVNQFGGLDTNYNVVYVAYTNYLNADNPGPWQSQRILDFDNPVTDYFSFALNSDLSTIGIEENGSVNPVPLINFINPADDILLGGISLAENFYNAELFEYRWHWDRWKLVNITTVDNVGTLSPSDNTLLRVYLNPNDYKRNTLYVYQFNPDPDSDFSIYSQPFFVKGSNTVITNGNLNISETFSGDYGLIYNNDTNTQSILDTLTDEQKENAALNDFDTILSGDASDVAGNLGFVNLASGGSGFFPLNIYTRLTDYFDQITDVLLESQPQSFSFYLHDNTGQIVLNTNDFITPNGPLKVFMQLFLVTCTIFVVWNQFYRYYELLSTFNVVLLMHDLDVEKTVFRM